MRFGSFFRTLTVNYVSDFIIKVFALPGAFTGLLIVKVSAKPTAFTGLFVVRVFVLLVALTGSFIVRVSIIPVAFAGLLRLIVRLLLVVRVSGIPVAITGLIVSECLVSLLHSRGLLSICCIHLIALV